MDIEQATAAPGENRDVQILCDKRVRTFVRWTYCRRTKGHSGPHRG